MPTAERQYLDLLRHVREHGVLKGDRTGTGTWEVFAPHLVVKAFDLETEFPLVTTRKIATRALIGELCAFIAGATNEREFSNRGCNFWKPWAADDGDLGPIYGKQWRDWDGHDQLKTALERLRSNPDCRRNIVSAWNVSDLDKMALHPCHVLYQFNVQEGRLNLSMYQRSADLFIGVPFNIASYAALTSLIARMAGLRPGSMTTFYGSAHIYTNHADAVDELLSREPMTPPTMSVNAPPDLSSVTPACFEIFDYQSHPAISGQPVAV